MIAVGKMKISNLPNGRIENAPNEFMLKTRRTDQRTAKYTNNCQPAGLKKTSKLMWKT